MDTFAAVIALWASAEELAADLLLEGANSGLRVRAWKYRNSIPPEFWLRLVTAAEQRGFAGVTLDRLARISATTPTPEATP